MDTQTVAVPLWFMQTIVGVAITSVLGGLGGLFLLVRKVDGIQQMLVGVDGKNGMRGDLRHLSRRHEELADQVTDQDRSLALVEQSVTDIRTRLGKVEDRERERGLAA